jgi:ankyrin repeat protein
MTASLDGPSVPEVGGSGTAGDARSSLLYQQIKGMPSRHVDAAPPVVARIVAALAGGADPNVQDGDGLTPLHWAAVRGQADVVRALLRHGADVNACSTEGAAGNTYSGLEGTPLQIAVNEENVALVDLLLRSGASVDHPSAAGDNPLIRAAVWGNVDIGRRLLEAGANVNATVTCPTMGTYVPGSTPLHMSIHNLNPAFVEFLLDHGADLRLRDGNGRSPVDVVEQRQVRYRGFGGPFPEDRLAEIRAILRRFQAAPP